MATTTRVLDANVSGTVYTSDLNDALEAIDTAHSGTTAPTDEVANGKLWLDTSATVHVLKVYRNGGWVPVVTNDDDTINVDYANAKVGVGFNTPTYRLDVWGSGVATVARVRNGVSGGVPSSTHGEFVVESADANMGIQLLGTATSNQKVSFGDPAAGAAGAVTYDHTGNYMAFTTNTSEKVRITSGGNVGLGSTSPVEKLDVTNGVARFANSITPTSEGDGAAYFGKVGGQAFVSCVNGFAVRDDGTDRFVVDLNGNVGIGTSSPACELDVLGDGLTGRFYSTTSNASYIRFDNTGSSEPYIGSVSGIGTFGCSDANPIRITTNNVERLRVTSAGDVGIGTTSPSEKLEVNGTVKATAFSGDGSGLTGVSSGMDFLATADAANDAVIDFTAFSSGNYDAYLFVVQNLTPSSDNQTLWLRTSPDSGATYDSDYGDYRVTGGTDSKIILTNNIGSGPGECVSGHVWMHGPHLVRRTTVLSNMIRVDAGTFAATELAGYRDVNTNIRAVRFLWSSGNHESGTITMYGLRSS